MSDKENSQMVKMLRLFSHRYEILQDLGAGGIGRVYQAYDRWINKNIAVKVLSAEAVNPSSVESFKREFLLLSQLKHPGVVEALDFGYSELCAQADVPSFEASSSFDTESHFVPSALSARQDEVQDMPLPGHKGIPESGVPYFTMELVEGKSLQEIFTDFSDPNQASAELKRLYHLIWKICDILEFLHLRGIVHCDLKPDNLKITERVFRPKILDFGLSEKIGARRGKETKGTLPYMAPEMFKEEPLDERTDLYSLGIILYELVTSQLPFFFDDPVKIISAHLEQKLEPPTALNPHLPPSLNQLIMKLLEKSPADRPRNATEVKGMIESGLKPDLKKTEQVDFSQERTSLAYLYSGPLVGREKESTQLEDYLKRMISLQGGCAYLSGEQGIGKTSLLHNLKIKSQLQGIIYVDSNCLENQTLAYQPLIEILRKLEPYVENRCPDHVIHNLREIFKGPGVSSSASSEAQALLQQKIYQLLLEISSSLPLVMVIENLQWADFYTLRFLEHFQTQADKGMIFLCCSRREDTSKDSPGLRTLMDHGLKQKDVEFIKLQRFDLSDTQNLVLSKLTHSDFSPEFFTSLRERTSGNPFFIIEVLKYLLENDVVFLKDSIWRLDIQRLKESKAPDSIEAVLLENLKRYDEKTLRFLNVVAVIGKRFTLRLVKELNLLNEKTLSETLSSLTNDQLLIKKEEFAGERTYYEFANQSLQSLLYQRWGKDKRIFWHNQTAELLRKHHPMEHEELIFEIARHFYEAGELDPAYKYALLSAKKMEQRSANQEVLGYLGNAVDIASRFADRQKAVEKQIVALMKRANFCRKTGELDQAEHDCQTILSLMEGSSHLKWLAKTYSILAETYRQRHDYKKGIFYVEKAMEIHQRINDPLGRADTLSFAGLLYWTDSQYQKALDHFHQLLEIDRTLTNKKYEASTLNNMGLVYWSQHQYSQALKCFEDALSVYRALDNREWIARTSNNIGATYFSFGKYDEAIHYYMESLKLNEQIKDKKEIALNLENLADAHQKKGDFENALKYNEMALALTENIALTKRVGYILENMGEIQFWLGNYKKAYEYFNQAIKSAKDIGDKELQILVLVNFSKFSTALNDDQRAMQMLEEATKIIDAINDKRSLTKVLQIRSHLRKKEKEFEEALALLDQAMYLTEKSSTQEELVSLNLEYSKLYLEWGNLEKTEELLNKTVNSGLSLYIVFQPEFYMISGKKEWISGNLKSAQNDFETALELAEKLNNPEMMWRNQHHLGKLFLSCHDIERAYQHLESAGRILKRLSGNIENEELKQNYLKDQEKKELLSNLKHAAKEIIGEAKMT